LQQSAREVVFLVYHDVQSVRILHLPHLADREGRAYRIRRLG
jgi:hypothetical protein